MKIFYAQASYFFLNLGHTNYLLNMQIIWDLSYIRIKNIQHIDHFLMKNKLADSG